MKKSFKQAWQLIRQNKLFSFIYIAGTGIAISVIMVVAVVYYAKVADIYPETNRSRTLALKIGIEKSMDGKSMSSYNLSRKYVEELLRPMKSPEILTAVIPAREPYSVEKEGQDELIEVRCKYVDADFWKVFPFRFISGAPFTAEEAASGIRSAVVASSLARELFGSGEAVGRLLKMNFNEYRICGVVKDASYITTDAFAQVWVPLSCSGEYDFSSGKTGMMGRMRVFMLAESPADMKKVIGETREQVARFNSTQQERVVALAGQPDPYRRSLFRSKSFKKPDMRSVALGYGVLFLGLLIIPAINLAGMISSRMERRFEEIGIRKAFGAPRRVLLWQILNENLLFTLLGGAVGLGISYAIIALAGNWLPSLLDQTGSYMPGTVEVAFTPGMLFNPFVFLTALAVCVILNLLSAWIPVRRSLKKSVVEALGTGK